mgnify:CR=1 FL=1
MLGRVVELVWGRSLHPVGVCRIAVGGLAASMLILVAGSGSVALIVAFTLLMGAAQGVISIARGSVPLAGS